jgi:hypothetical protein
MLSSQSYNKHLFLIPFQHKKKEIFKPFEGNWGITIFIKSMLITILMKVKTICRMAGVFDTAFWGSFAYFDYNIWADLFSGEYTLGYNITSGLLLSTKVGASLIITSGLADGLIDIVKGTHHYFYAKVWHKLTRNEKIKEKLGGLLENMLEIRENTFPYKAQE